ncbi:G protein-coupled receptor rhodopsin-like [Trinorchestia longiramus]|nr:G protein-coupled receptor rhodopsin-like [Trinorchestia longiramus]
MLVSVMLVSVMLVSVMLVSVMLVSVMFVSVMLVSVMLVSVMLVSVILLRQIVQQEAPADPLPPPPTTQEGSIYGSSGDVGGITERRLTEPSFRDSPSNTKLFARRRSTEQHHTRAPLKRNFSSDSSSVKSNHFCDLRDRDAGNAAVFSRCRSPFATVPHASSLCNGGVSPASQVSHACSSSSVQLENHVTATLKQRQMSVSFSSIPSVTVTSSITQANSESKEAECINLYQNRLMVPSPIKQGQKESSSERTTSAVIPNLVSKSASQDLSTSTTPNFKPKKRRRNSLDSQNHSCKNLQTSHMRRRSSCGNFLTVNYTEPRKESNAADDRSKSDQPTSVRDWSRFFPDLSMNSTNQRRHSYDVHQSYSDRQNTMPQKKYRNSVDGSYGARNRKDSDPRGRDRRSSSVVSYIIFQMLHTNRREVKAAKNLSIIVLFFMICWFPLYTINCINAFCSTCDVPLQLLNFTIILSHANSAINPILYAYHMKDFRYALKALLYGRLFGTKLLKHRPSTTIYRSHQSDRYLHRHRHGNGRDLNTAYRRSEPNRLTPTYDTPTNLTPLSVTPHNDTPTEHKLNPFCDSFQKALVQTLEKHSEIDKTSPDMSLVVDTLKIASLPPSQLHLTRDEPHFSKPNCPLIQVSTIPTPTDEEETDDNDQNGNDRNNHVMCENISLCGPADRSNESLNVESIFVAASDMDATEAGYLSSESERSFSRETDPSCIPEGISMPDGENESVNNVEDFLVAKIVSDPPYRDGLTADLRDDVTQVQKVDHHNDAS